MQTITDIATNAVISLWAIWALAAIIGLGATVRAFMDLWNDNDSKE